MCRLVEQVVTITERLGGYNAVEWYVFLIFLLCLARALTIGLLLSNQESEGRILHWVGCIVEEACDVVDLGDEEAEFHTDPESLSRAVLQIWAHFFMRNAQWPFINIMGESLRLYRDMA